MINILKRLKRLWELSIQYDTHYKQTVDLVNDFAKRLNEHTVIHADVHIKEASQIIVVGRYQNQDYVKVFFVTHKDFNELVDYLHTTEKNAMVGRFDMPSHGYPFSAVYNREVF